MGRVDLTVLHAKGQFRRLFAVKRIHAIFRGDTSFRTMFMDEARLAGLIHHPNVVSVLDVGEDGDGPYFVMEYIEGVTVNDLLAHVRRSGLMLPVQLCCLIASDAAKGLHAAHTLRTHDGERLQIVHRDISPQNILIGFDGVVRVTDFGIAKALGRQTETEGGVLKGKLGYMAPEQLRFEELDQRSDIYSLGVVLFEMLTGARLFPSSSGENERARLILSSPPPDIGEIRDDVPPALQALLLRVLAKSRDQRPGDADWVIKQLKPIIDEAIKVEGQIELGEYVLELFSDRRETVRAMVAQAIDSATSDNAGPAVERVDTVSTKLLGRRRDQGAVAAHGIDDDSLTIPTSVPINLDHDENRPRRRWLIVFAIAFVLVVASSVVGVIVAVNDGDDSISGTSLPTTSSAVTLPLPSELIEATTQESDADLGEHNSISRDADLPAKHVDAASDGNGDGDGEVESPSGVDRPRKRPSKWRRGGRGRGKQGLAPAKIPEPWPYE